MPSLAVWRPLLTPRPTPRTAPPRTAAAAAPPSFEVFTDACVAEGALVAPPLVVAPAPNASIAEQPVWGIDCCTRRNLEVGRRYVVEMTTCHITIGRLAVTYRFAA